MYIAAAVSGVLMPSTLGKNFTTQHFRIFDLYIMPKPVLFLGKNKKNINLVSAELAQRVIKVKG